MKKTVVTMMSAALLLSGCGTYTGTGAYMGTTLGGIFGSAIGGIAGGPHGSDVGTVVGMVGGAVAGAAIGQASDQKVEQRRQADMDQYQHDKAERAAARERRAQERHYGRGAEPMRVDTTSMALQQNLNDTVTRVANDDVYGSGFDSSNSGDDRIYDFNGSDYTGDYSSQQAKETMPMQSSVEEISEGLQYSPDIEVRNARFIDDNENGTIERKEMCKVIFEVYNKGQKTLYDVVPTVVETTGNKHVYISPNMHVERIAPGKGIRYTALLTTDGRLKDGSIRLCVSAVVGGKLVSKVSEFNIPTSKVKFTR